MSYQESEQHILFTDRQVIRFLRILFSKSGKMSIIAETNTFSINIIINGIISANTNGSVGVQNLKHYLTQSQMPVSESFCWTATGGIMWFSIYSYSNGNVMNATLRLHWTSKFVLQRCSEICITRSKTDEAFGFSAQSAFLFLSKKLNKDVIPFRSEWQSISDATETISRASDTAAFPLGWAAAQVSYQRNTAVKCMCDL